MVSSRIEHSQSFVGVWLWVGFFFYPLQKCSGTVEVNYEMLKPLNPLWLQATLRDLTQKTASGILLSAGNAAWLP